MATTPYNKYGMPNGAYAQGDQAGKANPIASTLQTDSPETPQQRSTASPPTGTSVTRDGKPDLAFQSPMPLTGRYSNGDFGVNDADQVLGNAYQTYLGRQGSQQEFNTHLINQGWHMGSNETIGSQGLNGVLQSIYNSPEANAYRTAHAQPTPDPTATTQTDGGPTDLHARIQKALTDVHSTDDPNYWFGKMDADPNAGGSAWNYWQDRINRGDGSDLVKSGKLTKFNDTQGNQTALNNALKFSVDPNSVMTRLQNGQPMTSDYTQQLLAQIKQSLALQNALNK